MIIHRANFDGGSQGKWPKVTMAHSPQFHHSKGQKGHDVATSQKPRQEEKIYLYIHGYMDFQSRQLMGGRGGREELEGPRAGRQGRWIKRWGGAAGNRWAARKVSRRTGRKNQQKGGLDSKVVFTECFSQTSCSSRSQSRPVGGSEKCMKMEKRKAKQAGAASSLWWKGRYPPGHNATRKP